MFTSNNFDKYLLNITNNVLLYIHVIPFTTYIIILNSFPYFQSSLPLSPKSKPISFLQIENFVSLSLSIVIIDAAPPSCDATHLSQFDSFSLKSLSFPFSSIFLSLE